jgi:hypothetical protein
MYVIPLVVLALVVLVGVAASPIFALIIAVPLFGAFLAYVALQPRADENEQEPAAGQPAQPASKSKTEGIWGEREA